MELREDIKRLAQFRHKDPKNLHHESIGLNMPHSSEKPSNLELLQKIIQGLPESQKFQYNKFKGLFTQNSPPEEKEQRKSTRTVTENPIIVQERQRTSSHDDIFDPTLLINNRRKSARRSLIVQGSFFNCNEPDINDIKNKNHGENIYLIDLDEQIIQDKFAFHSIYIGDLSAANNCSTLLNHSIHGIITIGQGNEPEKFPCVKNGYLVIPILEENFIGHAIHYGSKTLEFMISKGNVLIHSENGSDLGFIVAIGYLMHKFHLSYISAKEKILKNHPPVTISRKHENELLHLERNLY